MNQWLAEMYNTAPETKEASAEDLEAAAELEIFAKVAADQGIDLASMDADEVADLYQQVTKTASEEEGDDDDDDEEEAKEEGEKEASALVQAALDEHQEKKAAAEDCRS